jgi:oligopeptide/dipeptide ABC transporter ATP-binding protein
MITPNGDPQALHNRAKLRVDNLSVRFTLRDHTERGWLRAPTRTLTAVNAVSLAVHTGTSLGIVGESGCGKSTLASALVGLRAPDEGTISLDGRALQPRRSPRDARRIQMVFQDPLSSLNPRMTVRQTLSEVLRVHRLVPRAGTDARCRELIAMVELGESVLDRTPRSLSGGQRQRVAIIRALAAEPDILILDEAVAALDVSVQAAVLAVLRRLQQELTLTMLFISHDLAVVRTLCDEVAVMYLGGIVERASARQLFADPQHPYSQALMRSVPQIDVRRRPGTSGLTGEPPSAVARPSGCSFHTRCPRSQLICSTDPPQLRSLATDHLGACHFPGPPSEADSQSAGSKTMTHTAS